MIYEQMLNESKRLEKQIQDIHIQLESLPNGKLVCCHTNNHCKWYNYSPDGRIYITKKQRTIAEKLALKKYLLLLLKDITHEKRAIDFYLKHHSTKPSEASQLLLDDPEYQILLSSFFKPFSQKLTEWINSSYQKNEAHPEDLIHKSISGNIVRSKSEALIDMLLYTNKIPFRYECALYLDNTTFFPDFTIMHPHTGQLYYWEHFGMMDDPNYCRNAYLKLQTYTSNGIIPTVHLIMTFETKEHPLGSDMIEEIIEYYFK